MSKSFEDLEMEMEQLRAELRAEIAEARKEIAEARAIMTTLQSLASGEAAGQCVAVKSDVCALCSDEQPDEFVGVAGVPIEGNHDAAEIDRVWLMGAPATLSAMYDDALVLKEEQPWCAIDADGDVWSFSKRADLVEDFGLWWPDEDDDALSAQLGSIGGEVEPELWHWDAGAWTRVFPLITNH
jgi:hypothetical protein